MQTVRHGICRAAASTAQTTSSGGDCGDFLRATEPKLIARWKGRNATAAEARIKKKAACRKRRRRFPDKRWYRAKGLALIVGTIPA
jgi:hypothetical protein